MISNNKICILTTAHPIFSTRIFYKEAKTLLTTGCNVILIVQHDKDEKIDGVQIIALPKSKNRIYRMFVLNLKSLWLALRQKANVYHFHDPDLIPIGLLFKSLGRKVIYDAHEDVPRQTLSKEYIPIYLGPRVAWLIEKIENFACKRFDAVVAATPFIRDRFLRLGCLAVDVNNYPILSDLHLPEVDWSEKERAVCYVGSISNIRGIFEMVDAIGRTDAKLLLAGKFSPTSQRDLGAAMPGWVNVEELGQLTRSGVGQILTKSMAGLALFHPHSNHINAQPNKIFEYMSAGIPVIASNFPLWKQIIEANHCGICVDPMNPAEIAEAIQWIVDHPAESKQMGEKGRKLVKKKFNWEAEGKKLLSLYKQLTLLK